MNAVPRGSSPQAATLLDACHHLPAHAEPLAPLGGVEPGAVLAGRYYVDRVIGHGGMSIVVKAVHLHLQQPVAIKLLLPEFLDRHAVERFLREAQLAVQLTSEHVVRVIDFGTVASGAPFMVLEYLEGADLSQLSRSRLSIGEIVDFALQACEALAEAHALGIVHRDIKPSNLFVVRRPGRNPVLKVLDFGISKQALGAPLTKVGTVLGTPAYMSPEQILSSCSVDHRSDLWSLGVVLYRLLQGALPFDGEGFHAVAFQVLRGPTPELAVPAPRGLADIIYRCLEKDPARRFQTAAELAHELARHAGSQTQATISTHRTRRALDDMALARVCKSGAELAAAGAAPEPGGIRWAILAAVAVAACAIGVIAAIATRGPESPRAHAKASPAPAQAHALRVPVRLRATSPDSGGLSNMTHNIDTEIDTETDTDTDTDHPAPPAARVPLRRGITMLTAALALVVASAAPVAAAGRGKLLASGALVAPRDAPARVTDVITAANRIRTTPYIWGGGHSGWSARGYDCSGAVGYALHGGRLLSTPLVSGAMARWGVPGKGRWITVYSNADHAYAVIAGVRWDTSGNAHGSGPRWHRDLRSNAGFVARHPPGL